MQLDILKDIFFAAIISGIVGYATNYLAIKMLFRPYQPRWYSLGWQGIIPRNRAKLASSVGDMVANKLLSHDDLAYSLEAGNIKANIRGFLIDKLSLITRKKLSALIRFYNIEDRILQNRDSINSIINSIIRHFLSSILNRRVKRATIETTIKNIITSIGIISKLDALIFQELSMLLKSNKALKEILPSEIISKKDLLAIYITEKILEYLRSMGNDKKTQALIISKLIGLRSSLLSKPNEDEEAANPLSNLFGGLGGMFKNFGIQAFLTDEKIESIVEENLPIILAELSTNPDIYESIKNKLLEEIDKLLDSDVASISSKLSPNLTQIIHGFIMQGVLSKENIDSKIDSLINNIFFQNSDKSEEITLEDILASLKIDIYAHININIADLLTSASYPNIKASLLGNIANYIADNRHQIALYGSNLIISIARANLKPVLNMINIRSIVENKINSISLNEVEDLLFSFMRAHFRWINILGGILGFIIGGISQLIRFYANRF